MSPLSESVDQLRTNPRQWEAFNAEGHSVVLAPPGSGKTKLLTTRLAYDLRTRIAFPHGAACVTLTNLAAAEIRNRLRDLGLRPHANVFVGTVHSFALNAIILPFATLVGRPELMNVRIASSAEVTAAFARAIGHSYGNGHESRYVRSTIETYRTRLASDEQWALAGRKVKAVWRKYMEHLHDQQLVDFTELIKIAVDFVEQHRAIRVALTAKYPHLYIDEYQDLAPGLDRLVRALCFDHYNSAELFAVGDPDQAVFGFTGTRPELLTELATRTDVYSVQLERNYRCGHEIVRLASMIKDSDTEIVGNHDGGEVTVNYCPDGFAAQCNAVASKVAAAASVGMPLHEIAVICPTNAQCDSLSRTFAGHSIPVSFRNSDLYRVTPASAFIEGCASWSINGFETSNYRLADLLRQWQAILGPRATPGVEGTLIALLMEFADQDDVPAHRFIGRLCDIGLALGLARPNPAADADEANRMIEAYSSGVLSSDTLRELAARAQRSDRVEVTTMNSCKGLEFDVVAILGMDQNRVPFFKAIGDPEKMAEERRKFYVSLTRARHQIHIYYSGFVEWPNSLKRAGPSMFLTEIGLL